MKNKIPLDAAASHPQGGCAGHQGWELGALGALGAPALPAEQLEVAVASGVFQAWLSRADPSWQPCRCTGGFFV